MDKIAVLIPCYNEEKTIEKVVTDVREALPEAVVYVYDNNSTDKTAELAVKAGAILRHEYKQGKGNVIRRMFREIDAQCYLMIDGDDTYPLDCAKELVDKVLLHHADMVVGDRLSSTYFKENKRPFHNFGNTLMRTCINQLFHTDIKDIMTGYRAFSYEFVKTFPVFSKGFEIETEMTIHAVNYNLQVENVVVQYRDRPEGSESKLNTFRDGMKVIRKMLQLYKNYQPLKCFGLVAMILILVAIFALNEFVVSVCALIILEAGMAAFLHKAELWKHGVMLVAQIVAAIIIGRVPLVIICVIAYVAATVALQFMTKTSPKA